MLEAMRQGAKGWVAKVFLSLLVLSFAVWGINDWITGFQAADLVQVGKRSISSEEYRQTLNRTLQRLAQETGTAMTLEDARKLGIDQEVLEDMISNAAISDAGDRLSLSISDAAIAKQVQSNPIFQDSKGVFDPIKFKGILAQNGLTEAAFLAAEKANQTRAVLTGTAGENQYVPKTLLEALNTYREETRDGRYFTVKVSAAHVPAPSDADLKTQYDSTPAAYTAPEYRSIAVMKVEPSDMASKIEVTEEEIVALYEKNKADYFTPEKRDVLQLSFPDQAAAAAAKLKLDGGMDFAALAAEMKLKDTDYIFKERTREQFLDEKIAEAAFSLAEGAISAPVVGSLNIVLLKIAKIYPAKQASLEEVRAQVTERVKLDRAREEIQSVYDAVEDARAQQTKFEDIAEKAGIPLILVPAVSESGVDKQGQPVELPLAAELLRAVFASDVGEDTDALNFGDGFVWFDVREVIPSAVRPFGEVKDKVQADWTAAKLRALASDKAKAILEKAAGTTKLETLAQENGATIKTVTAVKRNNVREDFDGVSTLALFSGKQGSLTWALEGDGQGARIIEISKVDVPVLNAAGVTAQEISNTVKDGLGGDLLDGFLKSVRSNTEVVINEELWTQIRGPSTTQ